MLSISEQIRIDEVVFQVIDSFREMYLEDIKVYRPEWHQNACTRLYTPTMLVEDYVVLDREERLCFVIRSLANGEADECSACIPVRAEATKAYEVRDYASDRLDFILNLIKDDYSKEE